MTGINVVHVAYRGNAAALTDMLSGTLDFMFASPAEVQQHVRSGALKVLATSGETRSPTTADLPTVAEAGVPGYNFRTWHVLSMRSDVPSPIVDKMRHTLSEILTSDPFRKRLVELGLDPGISDGGEAERFVQSEIIRWSRIVKEAGIHAE
jgi:tripartite-type tricarboxylate transporter receptor subunit TctC